MADLILPPVLQVVYDRLASPLLQKLGNMWNLTNNFEKLQRTLGYVQSVLEDAEQQQLIRRDVRTWLAELKRVVYDAEDLLDEIAITCSNLGMQALGMKLDLLQIKYADKIRDVLDKLETTIDEGSKFNLRERSVFHVRRETSSFVIESEVYGREEDKVSIVKLLLSSEATQGGEASCIPIVGLGGLGKTTVAQLVFNDERVQQHFDVKTWVFVHDHYGAKDIMMAIFRSVNKDNKCLFSSMEELHSGVWNLLDKKRYLIVLDDVWIEDQDEWEKLRPLFRGGVNGSKIIITTRSRKVALMMNSPTSPYYLEGLSEDACWYVFMQRAFQPGEEEKYPDLLPVGRQIVKKCGGVALAAKTLGSLMRLKRDQMEWLSVQNCELWNLGECENGILPALRLSYFHLPPHLKRCFLFCSIIPRRFQINKEKLIHQWMAAGLIQSSREGEPPEETGNDNFNHLLWMSFFQEVKHYHNDVVVGYKMHDVIYDLVQSVAGTEFLILDHDSPPTGRSFERVRHSSVVCDFRSSDIPNALCEATHLRTLLLFSEGNFKRAPRKLYSSFKYLRELDLSACGLEVLDRSIGGLVFLRYLNLSHTHIKSLPHSIEKLNHLETLNVCGCYNLKELPNISRMKSLRHLNNSGCEALTATLTLDEYSKRTFNGTEIVLETEFCMVHQPIFHNALRTLPLFVVGGTFDLLFLQWLYLQGSLKITHLENVPVRLYPGFKALMKMKGVESLGLYWGDDADYCCLNTNPEQESAFTRFQEKRQYHSSRRQESLIQPDAQSVHVLDCLMPHENLKRLLVKEYPGYFFPDWKSLINLTCVELIDCKWCKDLPTLGNLMLLNRLLLQGMLGVKRIGEKFYGESTSRPFPALRELSLINFPNLREWFGPEGGGVFTSLSKLVIIECEQLTMMPQIQSIQHLELRGCRATLVHSFRNLTSLKVLAIQKVKDLSCFTGSFPVNNPLLTSLEIKCCPLLSLLPTFGDLTALKSLTIRWCEKLSYLPNGMQNLNALESLEIGDCHRLMLLPEIGTDGSCNLRTLSIENCSNLTSLSMGFKNLTCLEHMIIMFCPSLVTLPQYLQQLSALRSLTLLGFCPEFMFLPNELQNLTGLNSLEIRSCPGLIALPEWIEKLVSLRSLAISDCPKVTFLPEGMKCLTELQYLSIQDCPQLLQRCRQESGEDWPKIAHVPSKHIGLPTQRRPTEASSSSN